MDAVVLQLLQTLNKMTGGSQVTDSVPQWDGNNWTPQMVGGFVSSTRIINPTTSYTAPTSCSGLWAFCVGGGGAGGGAVATNASSAAVGGGGSGGSLGVAVLNTNIGSHTLAVGTGGSGVAGGIGGIGNDTTFNNSASTLVGDGVGGQGGATAGGAAPLIALGGGSQTSFTGTGGYGLISTAASPGWILSLTQFLSGNGGPSPWGGGGREGGAVGTSQAGTAAPIGGGGGSGAQNAISQAARAGGAGGNGQIQVYAFV